METDTIYSLKNVIIKTTDSCGTSEEAIKLKTKIEEWKTVKVKVVIGTSDKLIKFIILLTEESNLKNNETNILSEVMAFLDGKNKKYTKDKKSKKKSKFQRKKSKSLRKKSNKKSKFQRKKSKKI